jgi:hypothetical protein
VWGALPVAATLCWVVSACAGDPRPRGVEADSDYGDSGGIDAASGTEQDCDRVTDAGARICCGRAGEIPELSCVDLSLPGGEFGVWRECLTEGIEFDAKFAGATCCEGLTRTDSYREGDGGTEAPSCVASAAPSTKVCRPCGNGVCDPGEDRCNCLADCE